jgi:hypothetical protein
MHSVASALIYAAANAYAVISNSVPVHGDWPYWFEIADKIMGLHSMTPPHLPPAQGVLAASNSPLRSSPMVIASSSNHASPSQPNLEMDNSPRRNCGIR